MEELQKKIDEYNKKIHSKSGIGELYERQIKQHLKDLVVKR